MTERKKGRPVKFGSDPISLRLPDEWTAKLQQLAHDRYTNVSELIREAIGKYLREYHDDV